MKTKYVTSITILDPDSNLPVELEIRKLESGPLVGIDGSYLDQDVGSVYSPYDRDEELYIPDDEF